MKWLSDVLEAGGGRGGTEKRSPSTKRRLPGPVHIGISMYLHHGLALGNFKLHAGEERDDF